MKLPGIVKEAFFLKPKGTYSYLYIKIVGNPQIHVYFWSNRDNDWLLVGLDALHKYDDPLSAHEKQIISYDELRELLFVHLL